MANHTFPKKDVLLQGLQANILKPLNRDKVLCLFLEFKQGEETKILKWISDDLVNKITKASDHEKYAEAYRKIPDNGKGKHYGEIVKSFFITKSGFDFLSIDEQILPDDGSFNLGMKDGGEYKPGNDEIISKNGHSLTINMLGDEFIQWDKNYKEKNIHAMLLLAYNYDRGNSAEDNKMIKEISQIKGNIRPYIKNIFEEEGGRLSGNKRDNGHFGFKDGLSQPVFWKSLQQGQNKDTQSLETDNLHLALVKDNPNGYGSFFVFRKLQQHVNLFENKIKTLTKKINEEIDEQNRAQNKGCNFLLSSKKQYKKIDKKLILAQLMGRFPDGTPLIYKNDGMTKDQYRDFDNFDIKNDADKKIAYSNDKDGSICPFHAHIRKTNPRDLNKQFYKGYIKNRKGFTGDENRIERRIVRRGISYGKVNDQEKGLLFMSYQASIEFQFKSIQMDWCNNPSFPESVDWTKNERGIDQEKGTGKDPIIGQNNEYLYAQEINQQWNVPGLDKAKVSHNFTKERDKIKDRDIIKEVVICKGGEYFYAPSIPFLKSLGNK